MLECTEMHIHINLFPFLQQTHVVVVGPHGMS